MTDLDLSALDADFDGLPSKGKGGHSCVVQELAAAHPGAGPTIAKYIAATQYSTKRVSEVLTKHGLKISSTAVRKHRLGACTVCQDKEGTP